MKGSPRILVLNRPGAEARRDRLLEEIPTRPGFDRDEYPPAVGRGRANVNQRGLVRGTDPIGWLADVMYVPSDENRSQGSALGGLLRPVLQRHPVPLRVRVGGLTGTNDGDERRSQRVPFASFPRGLSVERADRGGELTLDTASAAPEHRDEPGGTSPAG